MPEEDAEPTPQPGPLPVPETPSPMTTQTHGDDRPHETTIWLDDKVERR
jgi:hypothetical protein